MSKVFQLCCDHPGCGMTLTGARAESLPKVRQVARSRGWRYRPGHPASPQKAADFCPTHAKEAT
jgi:hypothetical protein